MAALPHPSGTLRTISTTGASFSYGTWNFDPWPCTSRCKSGRYSGWNYYGYLADTARDGHSVYARGRVDGYGWAAKDTTTGWGGQKIYAPDPAGRGQMKVCRNRGYYPDNCQRSPWYHRG
jgi:hypothetical protein